MAIVPLAIVVPVPDIVPPFQLNAPLRVSVPAPLIVPPFSANAAAEVTVPVGIVNVPPRTATVPAPENVVPSPRLAVPASKPSTVLAAADRAPVLETVVVPWSEITPEETCTVPAPVSLKVTATTLVPVPPVLESVPW